MDKFNRKSHWENIYKTKRSNELSWFQQFPETSLYYVRKYDIPLNAKIIDIGGGDSYLVDYLLEMGYQNVSVLDISEEAIIRAKKRLGNKAQLVNWINTDIVTFKPSEKYDFWHDRAAFHFLTDELEILNYIETARNYINPKGILVIGTFSEQGPKKCSGIEIFQYSEATLFNRLKISFEKDNCMTVSHKTPFDTIQNFIFCSFRRRCNN